MFVGETGISTNHHFLTPKDGSTFRFSEGTYRLEVFAHLLGDNDRKLLFSQTLEITHEVAVALEEPSAGVYFDWGPDSSRYLTHVEKRAPLPDPEDFVELLGLARHSNGTSKKRGAA